MGKQKNSMKVLPVFSRRHFIYKQSKTECKKLQVLMNRKLAEACERENFLNYSSNNREGIKELSKFYNWIKKRSYEIEKDYDGYSRRIVPCESSHIELRYLPYINFFKEVIEMVALFSNTKKGEIETIVNKLSELKFKEELSIKQFHEKNMPSWFTNFK